MLLESSPIPKDPRAGKIAWYVESQILSATAQATAAAAAERLWVVVLRRQVVREELSTARASRGGRGKGVGLSGDSRQDRPETALDARDAKQAAAG
jgi:hypothetical protein